MLHCTSVFHHYCRKFWASDVAEPTATRCCTIGCKANCELMLWMENVEADGFIKIWQAFSGIQLMIEIHDCLWLLSFLDTNYWFVSAPIQIPTHPQRRHGNPASHICDKITTVYFCTVYLIYLHDGCQEMVSELVESWREAIFKAFFKLIILETILFQNVCDLLSTFI